MNTRIHPAPAATETADTVIDLRSRRRCQLERAGLDPIAVAVNLLAETGAVPGWDVTTYHDDDGYGWAA